MLLRYSCSRTESTFEWFEQSMELRCSCGSGVGVRLGVILDELPEMDSQQRNTVYNRTRAQGIPYRWTEQYGVMAHTGIDWGCNYIYTHIYASPINSHNIVDPNLQERYDYNRNVLHINHWTCTITDNCTCTLLVVDNNGLISIWYQYIGMFSNHLVKATSK